MGNSVIAAYLLHASMQPAAAATASFTQAWQADGLSKEQLKVSLPNRALVHSLPNLFVATCNAYVPSLVPFEGEACICRPWQMH